MNLQLQQKLDPRSITVMHQGRFKNLGLSNLLIMPRRMHSALWADAQAPGCGTMISRLGDVALMLDDLP